MGYTPHVLVVGGGVVGTAIARDFAIRGLDVTLVERGTLTAGATGRSLGVLDCGARIEDDQLARLAHRESQLLRTIAGHCIESTGGLLVEGESGPTLDVVREQIEDRGIPHEMLDAEEVRETEPALSTDVERALSVPDAVIDPLGLTVGNARSALEYGATVRTETALTDIATDGETIDTVTIEHDPTPSSSAEVPARGRAETDGGKPGTPGATRSEPDQTEKDVPGGSAAASEQPPERSTEELDPDYVVNATGCWAGEVAALAGLDVDISLTTGTAVLLDDSPVGTVVTHPSPTSGPTVTPRSGQAMVGTASEEADDPSQPVVSRERTDALLEQLSVTVPDIEETQQLRWDWGVHARHSNKEQGCEHVLVDHGDQDGCWGMTTVVGGSITTHRFVAEQVVDDVCAKFGITRECQTDEIPLPGSEEPAESDRSQSPVICECKSVTRADVRDALDDETAADTNLDEVRIRTGATMGECQGGKCAHRIAGELHLEYSEPVISESLDAFLEQRWQGQRYALCGKQLERAMQSYRFQVESLNLPAEDVNFVASKTDDVERALEDDETVSGDTVSLAAFDDGTRQRRRDRPMWGERSR